MPKKLIDRPARTARGIELTEAVVRAREAIERGGIESAREEMGRVWELSQYLTHAAVRPLTHYDDDATRDDIGQELYLDLVRAVRGFDASKGYLFSTYWKAAIYRNVRRAKRRTVHTIHVPQCQVEMPNRTKDDSIRQDAARATSAWDRSDLVLDRVADRDARIDLDLVREVLVRIGRLPERYRTVMLQSYFHGRMLQDIAIDMGLTRQGADALRQRATEKVRATFDSDNLEGTE